jgi:hypothetical protein
MPGVHAGRSICIEAGDAPKVSIPGAVLGPFER